MTAGEVPSLPVAVGIVTFRRPALLEELLDSLAGLQWPPGEGVVVIVDNDPAASAAAVVDSRQGRLPWPVSYVVEAEPGIAAARNAVVRAAAAAGVEVLAFVDDDETPEPDWLVRILATQRDTGADIVGGPVLARFSEGIPDWIIEGGGFRRRRFPTGVTFDPVDRPGDAGPRPSLGSGNLLLRLSVADRVDPPFDQAFGLTGGSDSLFVLRAERAGCRIAWCDEAIIHETVPADRTSVRWALRRARRVGNARTRAELLVASPMERAGARRQAGLTAGKALVRGVGRIGLSLLRGDRAGVLRGARHVATAAGIVGALVGSVTTEYAR